MPIDFNKAFELMADRGLTTYKIRMERIVSENALTSMRHNKSVTTDTIAKLCAALDCQPGDLMAYVPDSEE